MKIELIYFNGCPNIEPARENIRNALTESNLDVQWLEWEQSDKSAPDYTKQYGSPTILVDSKDVAGGPDDCCAPNSCRLYENGRAPSVEMITSALKKECCS